MWPLGARERTAADGTAPAKWLCPLGARERTAADGTAPAKWLVGRLAWLRGGEAS